MLLQKPESITFWLPIIQTLENPLEPSKKQLQSYGGNQTRQKKPTSILWGNRTQEKNSLNIMGEFPSKKHWQNCYRTLLDDYLEIDTIIGDVIFYGFADHILHPVREKNAFLGSLWKIKRELGGTRFINKACMLYKRLLGTFGVMQVQSKLRRSKFSQMEEWCPQNINKFAWFSGLGAWLSPWSHGFNPCCIYVFFFLLD